VTVRTLHIDPADAAPIWRQIEEGVRHLIAARALAPGGAVPSVRELARDLRVNPATVAKAYQRLTDAGVLCVRRGEGTFVADAPPRMAERERQQALHDGARRYATLGVMLGTPYEQATTALVDAWRELTGSPEGGEA
jgi:GntR family transcriptional regulator